MALKNNNPGRILKGTKSQPTLKGASGIWTLDEALQAHRANQWPQPNLYQPISNSLRIKSGTQSTPSYLTKPVHRDGTRRAFTFSTWIKMNPTIPSGSLRTIFEGFTGASNGYSLFYLDSSYNLHFGTDDNNSSVGGNASTSAVFRDPSAWYHIMLVVDSFQSTLANRVKIWVNGVQQTVNAGGTTPPQGYMYFVGVSQPDASNPTIANSYGAGIRIGTRWNTTYSQDMDGFYSETYLIDGFALPPTLFGQLDSNNTWVPIPYTGSYGTNGFYLPYTNPTSSQTIGYDASLNGTTTYTPDQDPFRGHVSLHVKANSPAGQQNSSFIDSSANNYTVTRTGSPTQGSFSPFNFDATIPYNPTVHGGSYYAGTGNYLTFASNSNWAVGTTATVEGWFYVSVATDLSGTNNKRLWAVTNNTTSLDAYFSNNNIYLHGANVNTTGAALQNNTWYHIAVVYNSGTLSIYINGIAQTLSGTTTGWNISATGTFGIGTLPGQTPYEPGGYISSFRLTKGVAIYTSNFKPPRRPFGTLTNNLLTFSEDFTNAFWSPNNATVTSNATIAPDGTPTGAMLTSTALFASSDIASVTTFASNSNAYTYSIYAKAGTLYSFRHRVAFTGGTGLGYSVDVNLNAGTIVSAEGGYTSASITPVGNGWFRISITASNNGSGNTNYITQLYSGSLQTGLTGTLYIWGAQYEQSSSMTNYTPTPENFSTAPSLLLNFNNSAIVDNSSACNMIAVGNATITNSSKFGSGSMVFPNTGSTQTDYINVQNCNAYFPGDFTVEFWFMPYAISTSWTDYAAILDLSAGTSTDYNWWAIHQVNQTLYWATSNGTAATGNINVMQTGNVFTTANTWYHVAFVRNQTNLSFYVNGQLASTVSSNVAFGSQRTLTIGAQNATSTRFTRGQIDDLRITRNLARYTSNFVPPNRALPNIGGKSFVGGNVNTGIVKTFVSNSNTSTLNTSWTCPPDVTQVEVLVVAGGGGGGVCYGGGGGGGGLIYNNAYPVIPGQTYGIQVGQGGTNQVNVGGNGGPGTNSSFGNLVAIGGGYGGGNCGNNGGAGGSGGGGSGNGSTAYSGGSGTAGQGFGGNSGGSNGQSGGGGGAAGAGGIANNTTGNNGLQFGISGVPTYYAGGGTGGQASTTSGGLGGGGTGGTALAAGVANGTVNTGGGGGGSIISGTGVSGLGGSGIVMVRYTTNAVANSSDITTDNLVDSPTLYGHDYQNGGEVVGNYATWNPFEPALSGDSTSSGVTFLNGNLTVANATAGWLGQRSTIAYPNTGKYYFEVHIDSGSGPGISSGVEIGIISSTVESFTTTYLDGNASAYVYRLTGSIYAGGTNQGYIAPGYTIGDVVGVAFDAGAGVVTFYKNGVSVYSTSVTAGSYSPGLATYEVVTVSTNFGQRPWAFNPPAGFSALTTKNLPRPTIPQPNQHFDVVTYTGTGASQNITLPGGFQPDLVWIKDRTATNFHSIYDSVRGATKAIQSNTTTAEQTFATGLTAFNSNGFTVGAYSDTGNNGDSYVAWCWKAGNGTVTNNNGSVTSTVSVNAAAGFSIVSYAGAQSGTFTIGHGLNSAPNIIITKSRTSVDNWGVYYTMLGTNTNFAVLNTQAVQGSNSGTLTGGAYLISNATTLQIGSSAYANDSTSMIAYCWTAVPGFSSFGTYKGTGSADGPFIYTGFRPRYVLIKNTTTAGSWEIADSGRFPTNPIGTSTQNQIRAEASSTESTGPADPIDLLSNGFKCRSTGSGQNSSGDTFIYMAFAEVPFANNNANGK